MIYIEENVYHGQLDFNNGCGLGFAEIVRRQIRRPAMLYAILCYNEEDVVQNWSPEEDAATMERLHTVEKRMTAEGKLGPVARLQPTPTAKTIRKRGNEQFLLDGPFA